MPLSNLWLLLKALAVVLPFIINKIQEGKIKEATAKEIFDALDEEIGRRLQERINRARNAGDAVGARGMSDWIDPQDRAKGGGD